MKKVLSLVCLLAIAASCLFVLASCGATPNADPKAARENLAAEGYQIVDLKESFGSVLTGCKDTFLAIDPTNQNVNAEFYYFSNEEHAQSGLDVLKRLAEKKGINADLQILGKIVYSGASNIIDATNSAN